MSKMHPNHQETLMINIKIIVGLALLFSTAAVSADTVIEFKYDNKKSQFLTDGTKARINSRGTDEFMLVNFNRNTIYTVDPEKKQVFNLSDLSNSMPLISGFEPPKVRVDIKPSGNGTQIAGFNTKKYRLSANGDYCGTIYASKDALKGTAVENMLGTMKSMADSHLKSLGGFAAMIPTCQMARIRLTEKLPYIGAPMRVIDVEGNVDSEITRIIKNARVEPHNYSIPKNYHRISTDEKIEQAKQDGRQVEKTQLSKSEIRHRMREIRRGGRLSPEEKEQIRRYQDMMRQR